MFYKKIIFSLTLILTTIVSKAQMAGSIRTHLDSAITILEEKSIYGRIPNWPKVREDVYKKAQNAKSKAETFEAIQYAFQQLNDKHGFFMQYGKQYRIPDTLLEKRLSDSLKTLWSKG